MLHHVYGFMPSKASVHRILFALAFSWLAFSSHAQVSISGQVTERLGLPGVAVLLLNSDSVMMKGTVTDTVGRFVFENVDKGTYRISASMVGYGRYCSDPIMVDAEHIVLPEIILKEEIEQLSEIEIKGQRDLFEQTPDKVVINLQNSVTSAGNTVLEVLQKSAGVVIDRQANVIRIHGRSGVTIMINGKSVQLSTDGILQLLDGMAAASIEKIELMASPGARYDAEGSGGVIHIVTKDDTGLGTTASFSLTAGASWAETLGGNFSVQHKTRQTSWYADYALSRRHNLHIWKTEQHLTGNTFDNKTTAYSHRENVTLQQNLRAGVEWRLNNKTSIDFGITAYRRNWSLRAETDELNNAAADSTIATHMRIAEVNRWQSATGAIRLQRQLSATDALVMSVDYLYYDNYNPSSYEMNSLYEQTGVTETSAINLGKTTPIQFFVGRMDYRSDKNERFGWEAGLKSVYSVLDNDVSAVRSEQEKWVVDSSFSSSSSLSEYILAGYVGSKWRLNEQVEISGGLRYEFTHTSISSPVKKDVVNRKYGYLFPSFSLLKTLDTEKDLQFSYTKRITRPGYNDIAPYVFFWGPNAFSSGNTKLLPAVIDAVTASYHVKQWTVSLQATHAKNEIASFQPERDNESNLIYRSQNMEYLNTVALTNAYSTQILPWWDIQGNLTIQYQAGRSSHLPVNNTTRLWGWNMSMVNRIKLPKEFSIEISALYQSKTIFGVSEYLPSGSLNAGIQKNFGKHGVLQLSMDDILYTNRWRIKTNSPANNLTSNLEYDWHNQYIRLTYSRSLGNIKMKLVENKSGAEEERRRVN